MVRKGLPGAVIFDLRLAGQKNGPLWECTSQRVLCRYSNSMFYHNIVIFPLICQSTYVLFEIFFYNKEIPTSNAYFKIKLLFLEALI